MLQTLHLTCILNIILDLMSQNLNKGSKHVYELNYTELDACVAHYVYDLTACFFLYDICIMSIIPII